MQGPWKHLFVNGFWFLTDLWSMEAGRPYLDKVWSILPAEERSCSPTSLTPQTACLQREQLRAGKMDQTWSIPYHPPCLKLKGHTIAQAFAAIRNEPCFKVWRNTVWEGFSACVTTCGNLATPSAWPWIRFHLSRPRHGILCQQGGLATNLKDFYSRDNYY